VDYRALFRPCELKHCFWEPGDFERMSRKFDMPLSDQTEGIFSIECAARFLHNGSLWSGKALLGMVASGRASLVPYGLCES
jgi:hypothetical protein